MAPMDSRGHIDVAGLTHAGRVRTTNEDQFVVAHMSKTILVKETSLQLFDQTRLFGGSQGHLFLVADGMGGHASGKDASAIATDTVVNYVLNTMPWFFRLDDAHENDLREEMKQAIERAQSNVHALSVDNPARHGMGTTLTMAYVLWPRMYVVHVGDCRCYLLRNLELGQVTTPHTLVQRKVEEGLLTPEQVQESELSHVLLNAIGGTGPNEVFPDVYRSDLELGDAVILCSDGLNRHVTDEDITAIVSTRASAREACRDLVEAALAAGGQDNVTVIVACFRDGAAAALEEAKQEKDEAMSREADQARHGQQGGRRPLRSRAPSAGRDWLQ